MYLGLTYILQGLAKSHFEDQLLHKRIVYNQLNTWAAELNTILWHANIETIGTYLLDSYLFLISNLFRLKFTRKKINVY